jgi:hypothetical protein
VVPFPSKRRPRLKNDEVRTREYLTRDEVEQLIKAAAIIVMAIAIRR